ncbi:Legumin J [Senna tora]|uniref:Legumin J n=1 Tax=Senna tora TaxID=362788 RepID=A0A834TA58_9FABA|nr:Legumin J [Senna tora]
MWRVRSRGEQNLLITPTLDGGGLVLRNAECISQHLCWNSPEHRCPPHHGAHHCPIDNPFGTQFEPFKDWEVETVDGGNATSSGVIEICCSGATNVLAAKTSSDSYYLASLMKPTWRLKPTCCFLVYVKSLRQKLSVESTKHIPRLSSLLLLPLWVFYLSNKEHQWGLPLLRPLLCDESSGAAPAAALVVAVALSATIPNLVTLPSRTTLKNDVELRSRDVGWHVEALGMDGAPDNGDTSASDLGAVGIPGLRQACFRLNAVIGFQRIDALQLALVQLSLSLP